MCVSGVFLEGSCEIHDRIIKFGFGFNVFVQNTLVGMYFKCIEELVLARQMFDEMPKRYVVSWNTMVGAYMNRADMAQAMSLFELMPVKVSWNTSVISALCKAGIMGLA